MNPEKAKYERMWAIPEYRVNSPGARLVPTFLDLVKPPPGSTLLDFGAGSGRASVELRKAGLAVTMVDFVPFSPNPEANFIPFVEADLEHPLPVTAEYGYCCDVMEHIPEAKVDVVLANLFDAAPRIFFNIARFQDTFGQWIGATLHVTVQPHEWWFNKFTPYNVLWSSIEPVSSLFYVTR